MASLSAIQSWRKENKQAAGNADIVDLGFARNIWFLRHLGVSHQKYCVHLRVRVRCPSTAGKVSSLKQSLTLCMPNHDVLLLPHVCATTFIQPLRLHAFSAPWLLWTRPLAGVCDPRASTVRTPIILNVFVECARDESREHSLPVMYDSPKDL